MQPSKDISRLVEIMAALRNPESGCPWDIEQDFETIAPYTIEEAYEVADAISNGSMGELKDELGDLLLQVVYHAQMASEADAFSFGDVIEAITTKMIRRHPHVFGDEDARNAGVAKGFWEKIKASERAQKQDGPDRENSLLDSVPIALPALTRALKLQQKAARVGFDWENRELVYEKFEEEVGELNSAITAGDSYRIEDEFGDVFFVLVNYARHCGVDPEKALRRTNDKFRRRFRHIESNIANSGSEIEKASLDEMEDLWQQAKSHERR